MTDVVIDVPKVVTSASAAPMDLARSFVSATQVDGCPTYRRWRGGFWEFRDCAYSPASDEAMRSRLYSHLEVVRVGEQGERIKPRQRQVNEVIDALASEVFLPDEIQPPAWLEAGNSSKKRPPAEDLLVVKNGFVHLPTLELISPTPGLWAHTASDVRYEKNASPPRRWLKFLGELWSDDSEAVEILQEWLGYLLSGDTSQQKILMIVGPRRAGKGTLLHVIRHLVGSGNVVAPSLGGLGQPFGLAPLIGGSVAMISDARISGRSDLAAVVETLLRVSGEDVVTVPRKFRPDWTGKLGVRFVIATNELPRLDDASGALASRLVPLLLRRSFYGVEDHDLLSALEGELEGILVWALEGLRRLRERGRLRVPASANDIARDMQALASPVSVFVEDTCELDPAATVPAADLYSAYKRWTETQGLRASSIQMFGRDLRAALPAVKLTHPRLPDGGRVRTYEGIRLVDLPPPPPCSRCGGSGCDWCDG